MKLNYKIKLDTSENQKRKKGFPVAVFLSYKAKRKKFLLGSYFQKYEWDFNKELPKDNHQESIFIKKKLLQLDEIAYQFRIGNVQSLELVKQTILGAKMSAPGSVTFFEFFTSLIKELKDANKYSNARVYENVFRQLQKFRQDFSFEEIDYLLLTNFKAWQLEKGNTKNTVHNYLRTFRAVYNEGCKRGLAADVKPFAGVFSGITVKSNRTKKKNLLKSDIEKIETIDGLSFSHQRALDLFLLCFYLGGQDLKDLYYLENQKLTNERVFFERGKLDGAGYEFDLKLFPKIKAIIDKYKVKGKYVFPWRKDFDGYRTFRDNFRRSLLKIQELYNIELQPLGGNIGIKVARHTFATIGKQNFIDPDLLRELMGHERDDVDTIYKDKFPEAVRDDAHLKIIG